MDGYYKSLISIVVPVYNCENYLDKCIKSILDQTYTNFELILINDGSVDKSIFILNNFKKIDSRIIVIDKENQGASETRNIGIELSKGDFICFIDADDWIDNDYLEIFVKNFERNDSLIIQDLIRGNKVKCKYKVGKYSFKNDLEIILCQNDLLNNGGPVAKFYSSEIIKKNNIRFNKKVTYGEDLIFFLEYLKYIDYIKFLSEAKYHYEFNGDSASTKKHTFYTYYLNHIAINNFKLLINCEADNVLNYLYKIDWNAIESAIYKGFLGDVYSEKMNYSNLEALNKSLDENHFKYSSTINRKIIYTLLKGKLYKSLIFYCLNILKLTKLLNNNLIKNQKL